MTAPDAPRIRIDDVLVEFPTAHGPKAAVDHVSLEIQAGERVGIIGPNGAGKTSLLQAIAGLLTPTSGRVDVMGHVSAVMTLGVGLRQDLSGRENIYTDGALSGRTRAEVEAVIDEIIAFTELGEFIDYPVRTYSTGMISRLAFAMVTFVRPEILIVDEALSAGDAQFGQKATAKVREICAQGKILLVVSHSLEAIEAMCSRCVWLESGKVKADGRPADVVAAYRKAARAQEEERLLALYEKRLGARGRGGTVEVAALHLVGPDGAERRIYGPDEPISLRFVVRSARRLACPDLRLRIERLDGNVVMESWASREGCPPGPIEGEAEFEVPLGPARLGHGSYELHLEVHDTAAPAAGPEASFQDVLRIERRAGVRDDPAYHAEVCWSFEKLSG